MEDNLPASFTLLMSLPNTPQGRIGITRIIIVLLYSKSGVGLWVL
jgi:hypothetical protein